MAAVDPDLAILWGVREIMSLVGILITTLSYWYAGRKWDEEGTAAYNVAVEASMGGDYQNVEEGLKNQKFVTNADGSRDAISVTTEDFRSPPDLIQVPIDRLEKAMSKNYGIILGLVVWAISFLFQPGRPVRVYVGWNISFILFLPLIAALLAFPMRRATIDRNLELKKKGLSFLLILSTWLVISGIADRKTDAPWYFCSLGGASRQYWEVVLAERSLYLQFSSFSPICLFFLPHHEAIEKNGRFLGCRGQASVESFSTTSWRSKSYSRILPHLDWNQWRPIHTWSVCLRIGSNLFELP